MKPDPTRSATSRLFGSDGRSSDELRAIRAPTLILIGDKDFISIEHAAHMLELIPDAQLAVLPRATYVEMTRRCHQVLGMVVRFLESLIPKLSIPGPVGSGPIPSTRSRARRPWSALPTPSVGAASTLGFVVLPDPHLRAKRTLYAATCECLPSAQRTPTMRWGIVFPRHIDSGDPGSWWIRPSGWPTRVGVHLRHRGHISTRILTARVGSPAMKEPS
jgi:hypothetical protein